MLVEFSCCDLNCNVEYSLNFSEIEGKIGVRGFKYKGILEY